MISCLLILSEVPIDSFIIVFQILTVKLGAVGGVGGSSPSSPDSSSDSSPPPTPQPGEGPNLEAEQCLPGVVCSLCFIIFLLRLHWTRHLIYVTIWKLFHVIVIAEVGVRRGGLGNN